jgi:hypothetical protein
MMRCSITDRGRDKPAILTDYPTPVVTDKVEPLGFHLNNPKLPKS